MNYKLIIILVILFFFITIPMSFAEGEVQSVDNSTGDDGIYSLPVDGEGILSAQEVYFNASADHDGDGSKENPYKTLTIQRIGYGNILYFANGVYELSRSATVNSATFIGEDVEKTIIVQNGRGISVSNSLTLKNLTLSKSTITNNGGVIKATNVIFNGGVAKFSDKYDGSFGGAIYNLVNEENNGYSDYPELYLDNCTFLNNNAVYGGAIYIEKGTLSINNSRFENNSADNLGGAIFIEDSSTINIQNTVFKGDYSKTGEAGAIHVSKSRLTMDNCTIEKCSATIGAGICDINSTTVISFLNAYYNNASYEGGVIYKMYGSISISSSKFERNSAKNGGAVYVDNASNFILTDNQFNSNKATLNGGALYSLGNSKRDFSNNTFENNIAEKNNNDLITDVYELQFGSGDYQMYKYNSSFNGTFPSRYNLVDDGYVTPVKDQQNGGNCWAFASLAALESSILKACNISLDFSEENMKNLMALFSDYGWKMSTNDGGYDEMAIAYLTSWLGPINESSDIYDDYSLISPIINSVAHVQNIIYLGRNDYTDNDAIKEAILNYGAVATGIYYAPSYLSSKNAFYCPSFNYANHAVTIVGWDDNYSKQNFLRTPNGDGAWIVKNSWGEDWGDNGYFYVSYYDKVFAEVGNPHYSYAFILNDSIRMDKNYQYDIPGVTDYFITGKDVIWYQNVFNATDNELLTAFSTYFNTTTDFQAFIYVNDDLKLVQNGSAVDGYYTFYLDQLIPLAINDTFRIALRINASTYASFPVSEKVRFTRTLYKPGCSFFSYDGETWYDLYEYKLTGYDHTYESQTACIKAFTSLTYLNTTIDVENYNVSILTPTNIVAYVHDGYGKNVSEGVVSFVIGGKEYYANVSNGVANITVSFEKLGLFNITAFYKSNSLFNPSNTTGLVNVSKSKVNLSLKVDDVLTYEDIISIINLKGLNGYDINSTVILEINNKKYDVDVVNGSSSFVIRDYLSAGDYEVLVTFEGTDDYYGTSTSANLTVTNRTISMNMFLDVVDVKNLLITVNLNESINGTFIAFLNNKSLEINYTSGLAQILIENLPYDNYTINVLFNKEGYFDANITENVEIRQIKTFINASDIKMYYHDGTIFYITLFDENNNPLSNQTVVFTINGVNYRRVTDENASTSLPINLNSNNYTILVRYGGSDIYCPCVASRNITILPTLYAKDIVKYYKNDTQYDVTLYDNSGNTIANQSVKLNINGVFYTRTTDANGMARLNINLIPGTYVITALNQQTGEMISNTVCVLPRIIENHDLVKYYKNASRYSLKILDKQGNILPERTVKFNINGIFYYRQSDEEGIVYMDINLPPGEYIITAEYDGSRVSNKITVLSTIESEDLKMSYKDGSEFKVHLLNATGGSAQNKTVRFNINGVFYYVVSDINGIASLRINLLPGEYIITSTYEGLSMSNKIIIYPRD